MAAEVASLFATIRLNDQMSRGLQNARRSLSGFGEGLQTAGRNLQNLGGQVTRVTAPLAAGLAGAAVMAGRFDQTMTNTGSLIGATRAEIEAMSAAVLEVGRNSRAGPDAAANAFYSVVSGVQDATTYMDVLNASIAASEAGNGNLTTVTDSMISVMNSYGLAAEDAARVSDVLTRSTQTGVGRMDEFAAAIAPLTGLASTLGIDYAELGQSLSYMTARGDGVNESMTAIRQSMVAFIRPNAAMESALEVMGYESGEAAVQALGLQGAIEALSAAVGGSTGDMAAALGSVEALKAGIALSGPGVDAFFAMYTEGMDGATEAARAIQNESPAAQFELLKSSLQGVAVQLGTAMLPLLNQMIPVLTDVVGRVTDWASENPELTKKILAVAGAAVVAGPVLSALGTAMRMGGGAARFMFSRTGMLLGAIGLVATKGITWADSLTGGEGSIASGLTKAAESAKNLAGILVVGLFGGLALVSGKLRSFVDDARERWPLVDGVFRVTEGIVMGILGTVQELINTLLNLPNILTSLDTRLGQNIAPEQIVSPTLSAQGRSGANTAIYTGSTGRMTEGRITGVPALIGNGPQGAVPLAKVVESLFPGRAMGGPVSAGQPYTVGEQGPELMVPSSSGTIIPNHAMGGVNISSVVVYANDEAGGRAAARGFADELKMRLRAQG